MMQSSVESQALVKSIGEHCLMHFGRENIKKMNVELDASDNSVEIYVATAQGQKKERDSIYAKFAEEIVPLFVWEAHLNLRFFEDDAEVFAGTSKAVNYALV